MIYDDLNKLAELATQKATAIIESISPKGTVTEKAKADAAAVLASIAVNTLTNQPSEGGKQAR